MVTDETPPINLGAFDEPPAPDLGGVFEVSVLLGITKSALADRRRHESFPKPIAELRCGPIWDLDVVRDYKEARNPLANYGRKPERWAYYSR